MSRIFNFDIQFGQMYIEAEDREFSRLYQSAWDLLTSHQIQKEEWIIVFNILGPALVREIKTVFPNAPNRMINEFINTLGKDDEGVRQMEAYGDEISKFTFVLRSRMEVVLKAASAPTASPKVIIDHHLGDLKKVFSRIPKYYISALHETLNLYQQG